MFVHKYIADGDTFYRVAESQSRPAGTVSLSTSDWKGKVTKTGKIQSAISIIEKAFHEEKPEEIIPKKRTKRSLSDNIKALASILPSE